MWTLTYLILLLLIFWNLKDQIIGSIHLVPIFLIYTAIIQVIVLIKTDSEYLCDHEGLSQYEYGFLEFCKKQHGNFL